jgi:hypothetical protein
MKTIKPLTWLACLTFLCSALHSRGEEMAVVKEAHVNVRGQPSLAGEVITQLQKGEKVVVLEEVAASKAKTNAPAKWARIKLPGNTPVWVYAPYLDPATKSVKVSRLNLRAGPGENYSVVGRLQRGATVTEIRRVEDWMEVETPPGAYGFVAAELLSKGAPETAPAVAKNEPTKAEAAKVEPVKPAPLPTPPPVIPTPQPSVQPAPNLSAVKESPGPVPTPGVSSPGVSSPGVSSPGVSSPGVSSPGPAVQPEAVPGIRNPLAQAQAEPVAPPAVQPSTPLPVVPAPTPQSEEPLLRRIVRREGLVRSTVSIQAPTYYELLNPDNRKTINYLHADNLDVKLKDYRGRRVVVTGQEAIDPRWPRTPVIEVEKLELIP